MGHFVGLGDPLIVRSGVRLYLHFKQAMPTLKFTQSGCGPCIGLGTGLLESGEVGISASNRKAHLLLASSNLPILECSLRIGNFKGRMGSTEAKAYLASPEVVASSALSGTISGPGSYKRPEGLTGVSIGEGHGSIGEGSQLMTAQEALERVIGQLESHIVTAEKEILPEEVPSAEEALVPILPGFPERVEGELLLLDADNINTGACLHIIHPLRGNETGVSRQGHCFPLALETCFTTFSSLWSGWADSNLYRCYLPR